MNNLHIQNTDKFVEPYIKFINKYFDSAEHTFAVVLTKNNNEFESKYPNIQYVRGKKSSIFKLIKLMNQSEKIFLHGLSDIKIVILLSMQPWLLKKSRWIVWGGDLYRYRKERNTRKQKIYEFIRRVVIKNIGGLITHIKGDYLLAKKWYGAKGKYYYSFMYPSNLYNEYDLSKISKNHDILYIQIGNSADPSNNHLEVLKKLEKYKDQNINIICPLSYGKEDYKKRVIKEGEEIFGDKFKPITDYMPFNEYLEILAMIDIAIFNHKRQQAMGNIITLLGLGKKVYIREEITTWQFCIDHDLKVYNANDGFEDLFEEMDEVIKQKNIENIKTKFSEEKLVEDLTKIFNS